MRKYMESYPTICVGRILTYPSYGGPQDCRRRAFDVHSDNQSTRLVSRVRRVQKGHTVTYIILSMLLELYLLSILLDQLLN